MVYAEFINEKGEKVLLTTLVEKPIFFLYSGNQLQEKENLKAFFALIIQNKEKFGTLYFIDTEVRTWADIEPQKTYLTNLKNAGIKYKIYSLEEIRSGKISDTEHCFREGYDYKKARNELEELIKSKKGKLDEQIQCLVEKHKKKTKQLDENAIQVVKEKASVALMLSGTIFFPHNVPDIVQNTLISEKINPKLSFQGYKLQKNLKEEKKKENSSQPKHSLELVWQRPSSNDIFTCTYKGDNPELCIGIMRTVVENLQESLIVEESTKRYEASIKKYKEELEKQNGQVLFNNKTEEESKGLTNQPKLEIPSNK